MQINKYIGLKAINTSVSTSSGKVGVISDFMEDTLVKGNKYTLQFKIIDSLNSKIFNWIYLVFEDGSEQKLNDINLDNFNECGDLQGLKEKLCYFTFTSQHSGLARLTIARKQTNIDTTNSTAFMVREIDIKSGSNLTDFTTNTKEDAYTTVRMYSIIQQLADNLNLKVGKNDIISSINLSPEQIKLDSRKILLRAEDVRVAWNNINDSISLRSDELAMYGAGTGSGKRLSLKRGLLNTYRDKDNGFLGYYGMDRTYDKYYGTTNLGSYYSWFFGIAQDTTMDHDSDYSTDKKYYIYASFADHESYNKGVHIVEAPLYIWKSIQMKGNNIYELGNLYFDSSYYSRISKMSNRGLIVEGDPELQLGFHRDGKFDVCLQMMNSYPWDIFSYKHLDMQGRTIKNAVVTASYSMSNTSPNRSVGADTISVESMLLQEDYAEYDDENNAVIVNINEAIKSVYSRNKQLEDENKTLKVENENLNTELSITKSAIDELIMGGI